MYKDQTGWLSGITVALVIVVLMLFFGLFSTYQKISKLQNRIRDLNLALSLQGSTLDQHAQLINEHTQELANLSSSVQSNADATQSLAATVDYNANMQNYNAGN